MKGRLRNGKIINGRLAELFVSRGIAVEVKENTETEKANVVNSTETKESTSKRKRRTKAQIEADKNK